MVRAASAAPFTEEGRPLQLSHFGEIAPYVVAIPASFFLGGLFGPVTHPNVHFIVRRRGQAQSSLMFPNITSSPQQMAMQAFRHRTQIASTNGFVGGFPNFYETTQGRNHFGGTIFVKQAAAEWRDVPLSDLGNISLEDFAERIRATNSWARQHGFIGGFPTFFHANYGSGDVCGSVLIKAGGGEFRDIPLSDLGNPSLDDFQARFRGGGKITQLEAFQVHGENPRHTAIGLSLSFAPN